MRTGCWETGMQVWLNGGAHHGLEHKREVKPGVWRTVKPAATATPGSAWAPRASGTRARSR
jgi:hypothetical protein